MLNLALTGGIGSGKSAVSTILDELGATIVDADKIAREVVEPGTEGLALVREAFGERVIGADGALDRPALAEIVFNDEPSRLRLNGIVHPLVRSRSAELVAAAGPQAVIVNDIPLLAEGSGAPSFHLVLVVDTPVDVRLQRLTGARGMNRADAEARIAAQATDTQRLAIADVVFDNDGSLEQLREQVADAWQRRLVPFAENLHGQRAAEHEVETREGSPDRELARVTTALAAHPVEIRPISGTIEVDAADADPAGVLRALAGAGWFETGAQLRSADPGAVSRLQVVARK